MKIDVLRQRVFSNQMDARGRWGRRRHDVLGDCWPDVFGAQDAASTEIPLRRTIRRFEGVLVTTTRSAAG
jgi:hypothetical protein